jgi:DNA-directed RNA polymerase beta subunit
MMTDRGRFIVNGTEQVRLQPEMEKLKDILGLELDMPEPGRGC